MIGLLRSGSPQFTFCLCVSLAFLGPSLAGGDENPPKMPAGMKTGVTTSTSSTAHEAVASSSSRSSSSSSADKTNSDVTVKELKEYDGKSFFFGVVRDR